MDLLLLHLLTNDHGEWQLIMVAFSDNLVFLQTYYTRARMWWFPSKEVSDVD